MKELDLEGLNEEEIKSLRSLVFDYADLFYVTGRKFSSTPWIKQKIELKDTTPVKCRVFRHPPEVKKQFLF